MGIKVPIKHSLGLISLQLVALFILSLFFCLQHACLLIDQVDHCLTVFSVFLQQSDNLQPWPTVTADLVAHRSDTEIGAAQKPAGAIICLTRMIGGQLPGKQLSKTLIPASFSTFFFILCILFMLVAYFLCNVWIFFTLVHHSPTGICFCLPTVAPSVRIVPPSGILREGDSLSLTCSVTGNPL